MTPGRILATGIIFELIMGVIDMNKVLQESVLVSKAQSVALLPLDCCVEQTAEQGT
jgi:hypothetical protein